MNQGMFHFSGDIVKVLGAKKHRDNLYLDFIVRQEIEKGMYQSFTCRMRNKAAEYIGTCPKFKAGMKVWGYGRLNWSQPEGVMMNAMFVSGDEPFSKFAEAKPKRGQTVVYTE